MKIAILGAGNVGGTLAAGWKAAGHEIVIAARNPDSPKVKAAAAATGASIEEIADAAVNAEAILLATPWAAVPDALSAAEDLSGKLVMDATNPLLPEFAGLDHKEGRSGAEQVQKLAPRALVVKIFNTTGSANMAKPDGATMLYAGDNTAAKKAAAKLASDIGFNPVNAGPLAHAKLLEYHALLWITLAYKQQLGPEYVFNIEKRE
jgi:8-hydroxy-5-deazaflavin:NADPH oxidoreductase